MVTSQRNSFDKNTKIKTAIFYLGNGFNYYFKIYYNSEFG